MTELIPCPHCGNTNLHYDPDIQSIACPCSATGPSMLQEEFDDEGKTYDQVEEEIAEAAAKAWNRRVAPFSPDHPAAKQVEPYPRTNDPNERIAELEKALEPFAEAAEQLDRSDAGWDDRGRVKNSWFFDDEKIKNASRVLRRRST